MAEGSEEKRPIPKTTYELSEIPEFFPNLQNPERLLTELEQPAFKALGGLQHALGAQFYLEGGTNRDTLLGMDAKDYDFVISFPEDPKNTDYATRADLIQAFEDFFGEKEYPDGEDKPWIIHGDYGTLKLTGESFGVYKFYPRGGDIDIDISLPRTEFSPEYGLGGAKNIEVQSDPRMSFEEEVQRRDFTVNGLGLKLDFLGNGEVAGVLVDCVGGLEDLNDGVLRAIGDPYERLTQSLDRLTRAIRFSVTKGLELDPALEEAMQVVISGECSESPGRPFERVYPTGKYVMGRPNIGVNLAKSLGADPVGTIEVARRVGAFQDLFSHWDHFEPPKSLPKEAPADLLDKLRASDVSANDSLRERYLGTALNALKVHLHNYPNASMDEVMFLLSLDLGKCTATLSSQQGERSFYQKDYTCVSMMYLSETIHETGLDTLSRDSPYRIDKTRINSWLGNWHVVVGMLSDPESIALNGERFRKLKDIFPDLSKDPFWALAKSYMSVCPDATGAAQSLTAFEEVLLEVQKAEEKVPFEERSLLRGGDLVSSFYLSPSPAIKSVCEAAYNKYWDAAYNSDRPITAEQAKLGIFLEITHSSELRNAWNGLIDQNDIDVLAGDTYEPKYVRRSIMRALERRAFLSYMGSTMEGYIGEEVFAEEYKRRYTTPELDGYEVIRYEMLSLLSESLVDSPGQVLAWLEKGFKKKDSLVARLFPELKAMYKCEQPQKYHTEGDVWEHTKLLFASAKEQGLELTPEFAMAILFHDVGKPPTQEIKTAEDGGRIITFINHAGVGREIFENHAYFMGLQEVNLDVSEISRAIGMHMHFFHSGRAPTALEVRDSFPRGTEDILYKLILCDTIASVASEEVETSEAVLAAVENWGTKISLEQDLDPEYFERTVLQDPVIAELIQRSGNAGTLNALYERYLDRLSSDHLPAAKEVLNDFVRADFGNARLYVSRVMWPGRKVIAERGLEGKAIGGFQQQVAEEVFESGLPE